MLPKAKPPLPPPAKPPPQRIPEQGIAADQAKKLLPTLKVGDRLPPPKALQSWRPSKEVPKPWPGKVPKKMLREVPVRNGVPRKVPKKVLRVPSPMLPLHRRGTRSTFFGTFLGTPFRTGTSRSTFFGTFPGQGFGTSLDGRQDCNQSTASDKVQSRGRTETPEGRPNELVKKLGPEKEEKGTQNLGCHSSSSAPPKVGPTHLYQVL